MKESLGKNKGIGKIAGAKLIDRLNDQNKVMQENALIALSAISLSIDMPVEAFFQNGKDPHLNFINFSVDIIQRLLQIANQLQHSTTITAMDALRNLII